MAPAQRPAWRALAAHHAAIGTRHLRELFAADAGRGERLVARGRRPLPRLLEEPRHRRDAAPARRARRRVRAARAHRGRCSAASRSTSPNSARSLHVALRMPKGDRSSSTASTSWPRCTACSTAWPRSPSGPQRPLARPHRPAHPQRRQHRHRRLRPRPGDGVRGAAPLQRPRADAAASSPTSTAPTSPRRRATSTPRETLFIVCSKTFTTLETLTNARAARAWCVGRARRRRGGREALRRGLDQRRRRGGIRHRHRQHVRLLGLGRRTLLDGFGDRAVDDASPSAPTTSRDMLAGFHAMDEHFRSAPLERNMPVLMGLLSVWNNDFFGAATQRRAAVRPVPQALPRLPAAADDGEQRQARHAGRRAPSTTTPRRSSGASPAPTASTRSTS